LHLLASVLFCWLESTRLDAFREPARPEQHRRGLDPQDASRLPVCVVRGYRRTAAVAEQERATRDRFWEKPTLGVDDRAEERSGACLLPAHVGATNNARLGSGTAARARVGFERPGASIDRYLAEKPERKVFAVDPSRCR